MLFRINFLLLVLLFTAFSSANNISQFKESFSSQVKKQFKAYNIPGGAYAIVQNDTIIAMETFGHTDKAKSHQVDYNTVFRLASVSKTFAATVTTCLLYTSPSPRD